MRKLLLIIATATVLTSCGVFVPYEEDLCTPHPGDFRIVDVNEKWITIQNGYESRRLRNRDSLTAKNIGDWLILEDEFRMHH